ncbi:MAG: threonine--tRNA ligase [Gammaproteobacteria bacterium]|jgi:threonyl-tRNA synthetase|nr:threonine--tRNA ligase [Gammaproteobacteria bacterium]MBT4461941.1 threonine--tRNA ligase [Gammaproteobacteria bacterium]MBT4655142.1 threonine--tRNA ligase [Gammaproteobacteria bacterium]MBT5116747.1 threonine--tRNA ligase [Gammaproteobacteria bacterium]MBT5761394.1 threonine--tRNA ligase [Gammaproteobacteria bacterium]
MYKVNIDNKVIETDGSLSLDELVKNNFSNLRPIAARVDGILMDMSEIINKDSSIEIISSSDKEGIEIIRHTCAHVFGHAIKQLYPDTKMVIGPVIDNGFYYDIYSKESISEKDLSSIEALMKKLAKKNYKITREVVTKKKAQDVFKKRNEDYKLKLIDEIPSNEIIAIYHHEEYIDMCRGPHLTSTRELNYFKLMKVSGSYWKGDSKNVQLQRIYGTAWDTKDNLKAYLRKLEEAEKRDHRKIGQKLDLFHFQEESPGMVFWHDSGWKIFNIVKDFITSYLRNYDYKIINTPQILDKTLWKKSGHLDKFSDLIFDVSSEHKEYAIKPMSCPGHIQVYNQGLKSYKDLPIKFAEFGVVHRNEPSGTLHGLMRIRAFTQDDAHIFCTPNQIEDEIKILIKTIYEIYKQFGFEDIKVELSTRPEKRVGSEEIWDKSENALKKALDSSEIEWQLNEGDGAFYGPKIDFSLKDSLERVWQLGTIQLDFSMPERLNASYIDKNGDKLAPVMIHRAILGSLERFVGILIEEYAGDLPLWLAPVHAVVINISENQEEHCLKLLKKLNNLGIVSTIDMRNEKINYKIRDHSIKRVPYLLVVGDKEVESNQVSIRTRTGEDLGVMDVDKFVKMVETLLDSKSNALNK